jgi:hypothetical protein
VQLPRTACLNPSPSYYKQFNGYTLGLMFAILLIVIMRLAGTRVLARVTLDHCPRDERLQRLDRFRNALTARTLILLYVVYPGVSVAVFGIFSCTHIRGAGYFLDADFSIVCYTRKHWGYVGAGVIWVFVYTLGIPLFFVSLLRRYHVPLLAKTRINNAWLFEAAKLAHVRGLEQADLNEHDCTVDGITDAHLGGLYAFHVQRLGVPEAGAILRGESPLLDIQEGLEKKGGPWQKRSKRWVKAVVLSAATQLTGAKQPSSAEKRKRAATLSKLLHWCRRSGELGLPQLSWATSQERTPERGSKVGGGKEVTVADASEDPDDAEVRVDSQRHQVDEERARGPSSGEAVGGVASA